MTAQPMGYMIQFDVKPGREADFRAAVDPVLDAMREEAGFVYSALTRDAETPDRFVLFEIWSDHDDVMNVQLKRPYRAPMDAALEDILSSPRGVSMLHPLRTDT